MLAKTVFRLRIYYFSDPYLNFSLFGMDPDPVRGGGGRYWYPMNTIKMIVSFKILIKIFL